MTHQEGFVEAERRIEQAKAEQSSSLDLSSLPITSFPATFFELIQLEHLNCAETQITSLEDLKGLAQLKSLDCSQTQITSLEPLKGLTQLERLNCWNTQIASLENLKGLTELKHLSFWDTQITSLEPLKGLIQLEHLDCSRTQITSLENLKGLAQLESLDCSQTQITSLENLKGLAQLESLDCSRTQITSLENLKGLAQLESLDCSQTQITSLEDLKGLAQLESLDCSDTQITSLEDLKGLTELKHLSFWDTQITSLEPLKELSQLESLNCSRTQITSLEPLKELSQLEILNCSSTQITSLEPLKGLTQLERLNCWNTQIASLENLKGLTELKHLSLWETQVTSLEGLERLTQLEILDCSDTQITSLEPLKGLIQLKHLDCSDTQITSLEPLKGLAQLEILDCSDTQITSLEPLKGLIQLKHLDCADTQITSLEPLKGLIQLKHLDCADTQITSLGPPKGLIQLESLDCSDTQITSLEPLKGLIQLESLNCSSTQITSLEPLKGLIQLESLDCSDTQITSLEPLKGFTQLDNLYCSRTQITSLEPLLELTQLREFHCRSLDLESCSEVFSLVPRLETFASLGSRIPNVPKEVIDSTSFLGVGLWESYLDALKTEGGVQNRTVKLIAVGNGEVGKTSVIKALRDGSCDEPPASTHGIELGEFDLSAFDQQNGKPWNVKTWDFGGQELYLVTHRLFFQEGAVYLLVWSEEKENDPYSSRYWLDQVRSRAPNCPVLLIKNKVDFHSERKGAFPEGIEEDDVVDSCRFAAKPGKGVYQARGALTDIIKERDELWNYEIPASWHQTGKAIENLRNQRSISRRHFERLCPNHTDAVLRYLHETGVLFHQPGLFDDEIYVDQNWLIDKVYRLFDRGTQPERVAGTPNVVEDIRVGNGKFLGRRFKDLWPDHSEEEHALFARFLRSNALAFSLEPKSTSLYEQRFIVPEHLPPCPLTIETLLKQSGESFSISSAALHRGIVDLLMIKAAEEKRERQFWHGGLSYQEPGSITQVIVVFDTSDSKPTIRGKMYDSSEAAWAWLGNFIGENVRGTEAEVQRDGAEPELLSEILERMKDDRIAQKTTQDAKPDKAVEIFISYSHADELYKTNLEKRLKIIRRNNIAVNWWSDRDMLGGAELEKNIFAALSKADIVLMLISRIS